MNSQPESRFSNRVGAYARFRPGYPEDLVNALLSGKKAQDTQIADIGSGTGIFTRLLLEAGATVYAVEPNSPMRRAAEESLGHFPGFRSVAGTAEASTIADHSVDLVVAAQAFHWFQPALARKEFMRILKQDGRVALVWNERQDTEPGFDLDYEQFLIDHSTDYLRVKHQQAATPERLRAFYGNDPKMIEFPHSQVLNAAGLRGRYDSCSYALSPDDELYKSALLKLNLIFERYQQQGQIEMRYRAVLYLGSLE